MTTRSLPRIANGSRSFAWWGMLLLIANEAILFASLLSSYLYTRFNSPVWPPDGIKRPELTLPLIGTVVLLSSSVVMQIAEHGVRHDDQRRLRIGLAVAFVLAVIFLGIQAYEYSHSEFGPTVNTYGSLFFTITGIHGLHVFIALLINAAIQVKNALRPYSSTNRVAVENTVMYWHFVDAVWIFVLITIYLSPYV